MNEHPNVSLITPFETEVQVDVEIAPLVQSLWKLDLCTFNSCQNNFGYVWLHFPSDDAVQFLTYVMQYGDPISSHRATEPYDVSPQHRSQLEDYNAPEDSWLIGADVSEIGGKITDRHRHPLPTGASLARQ